MPFVSCLWTRPLSALLAGWDRLAPARRAEKGRVSFFLRKPSVLCQTTSAKSDDSTTLPKSDDSTIRKRRFSLHDPSTSAPKDEDKTTSYEAVGKTTSFLKLGSRYTDRVLTASIAANKCMEDRLCASESFPDGLFCGVFDGHGGAQVAQFLAERLPQFLSEETVTIGTSSSDSQDSQITQAETALISIFRRAEADLWKAAQGAASLGFSGPSRVGACAIAGLLLQRPGSEETQFVVVANIGDCRCVLGREEEKGQVSAVALSDVHNSNEPGERAKLRAAFPDDNQIVQCQSQRIINGLLVESSCYVKGALQPTRTIGDFYLKHEEVLAKCKIN